MDFPQPWSSFVNPDLGLSVPRLLLLAVAVLIFRRLPIVVALYKLIPAISNWHEAVFAGWFGPMGVGSVFYSTVALANFSPDGPNAMARQLIEPIVYFIVLSSIVAHGASVPLFTVTRHAKQCFQENQSSTQYTRDVSVSIHTLQKLMCPADIAGIDTGVYNFDVRLASYLPYAPFRAVTQHPDNVHTSSLCCIPYMLLASRYYCILVSLKRLLPLFLGSHRSYPSRLWNVHFIALKISVIWLCKLMKRILYLEVTFAYDEHRPNPSLSNIYIHLIPVTGSEIYKRYYREISRVAILAKRTNDELKLLVQIFLLRNIQALIL